jgi:hypothetical protein
MQGRELRLRVHGGRPVRAHRSQDAQEENPKGTDIALAPKYIVRYALLFFTRWECILDMGKHEEDRSATEAQTGASTSLPHAFSTQRRYSCSPFLPI